MFLSLETRSRTLEHIAVRRRRRRIESLKTPSKNNSMDVVIDGRSVKTPGGTRYGRDASLDVDTSYHSEGSIPQDQFVQGMCDIVELRIDNLRPTENQFTEADFLDSEPDEDEFPVPTSWAWYKCWIVFRQQRNNTRPGAFSPPLQHERWGQLKGYLMVGLDIWTLLSTNTIQLTRRKELYSGYREASPATRRFE